MTVWLLSPSCLRTARKAHACRRDECSTDIEPGERYVEYLGESPAWQSGLRYHIACADAAGIRIVSDERPAKYYDAAP